MSPTTAHAIRSAEVVAEEALKHLRAVLQSLSPEPLWPGSEQYEAVRGAREFLKELES